VLKIKNDANEKIIKLKLNLYIKLLRIMDSNKRIIAICEKLKFKNPAIERFKNKIKTINTKIENFRLKSKAEFEDKNRSNE
jgi:hypothetical protein